MCSADITKALAKGRKGPVVPGSGGTAGGGISESRAMGAGLGQRRKGARLPQMPLLGLSEQPVV